MIPFGTEVEFFFSVLLLQFWSIEKMITPIQPFDTQKQATYQE